MADLIFLAVIVGFFGLAVLLVQACDRIIGPDPDVPDDLGVGQAATVGDREAVRS